MGFETEQEAEHWAESMEMAADQKREEKLLAPQTTHADDIATLGQIVALGKATGLLDTAENAYFLGRIRGRMEGAQDALDKLS